MPVSGVEFRACLACWASGVTVVTSAWQGRVHGMTVSAFSSVSLDPPLVLVCADKTSDTLAVIEKSRVFAANILSAGQQALSNRFASKKDEHLRFEGLAWRPAPTGAPILPDVLAALDCRVVSAHDAGDHVIYVGSVESVETFPGAPLLYYAGSYRGLAEPQAG